MGEWSPPFYGEKSVMQELEKITEIDAKINALAIEREKYVEALKKKLK